MKLRDLANALASVNLMTVRLAFRDSETARSYLSTNIRDYNERMGQGLPGKDPIAYIVEQGWGEFSATDRVQLPTRLQDGGGTRLDELLYLATATKVLRPKTIFEIGTFSGRTTSVFVFNAPADASINSGSTTAKQSECFAARSLH